MENQSSGSQNGSQKSLLDRLSQLETENNALQQENQLLRSSHQKAMESLENRLAIEEAYQESQQRFKTVFEQSKFGNKIITEDLRIVQVNEALQGMLGYSEKELIGSKVLYYAHPDYVKTWRELQKNLWKKQCSVPQKSDR